LVLGRVIIDFILVQHLKLLGVIIVLLW